MQETLQTLLESLVNKGIKVTITFEPKLGLTAEEVDKARKAGFEGKDIQL